MGIGGRWRCIRPGSQPFHFGTRISDAYHIKGVPETYFVAKNGELLGNVLGPFSAPQLDDKIELLLAEEYHP